MKLLSVKKGSPLNLSDRYVYSAIAWHKRKRVSHIAAASGLSRPTVRLALSRLRALRLVAQDGRDYAALPLTAEARATLWADKKGVTQAAFNVVPKPEPGLSPVARAVLGCVLSQNKKGKHPGKKAVARLLGLDDRTAARQVDALLQAKRLYAVQTGGYAIAQHTEDATPVAPPAAPPTPAAPPVATALEVPPVPPAPVATPEDDEYLETPKHWQAWQCVYANKLIDEEVPVPETIRIINDMGIGTGRLDFTLFDTWFDLVKKNHRRQRSLKQHLPPGCGRLLVTLLGRSDYTVTPAMIAQQEFYDRTGGKPKRQDDDDDDDELTEW